MRRREFVAAAGALVPIAGLKSRATPSARHSGGSATATRTFEITTRVEL